jgi:hypothetical protein
MARWGSPTPHRKHQQIPGSRPTQTHSDGSDIQLHHYTIAEVERWISLAELKLDTLSLPGPA